MVDHGSLHPDLVEWRSDIKFWTEYRPLREDTDGVLREPENSPPMQQATATVNSLSSIRELPEEEILYPRTPHNPVPLNPSVPQRPQRMKETYAEEGLSSSTESYESICLTNASNRPLRGVNRYALRIPDSRHTNSPHDYSKDEAFRMYRPVRGQVPSSDPESFYSGTRTATWHSRREGRVSSRAPPLAWTSVTSLRPKSPVHRPVSAVASRIADQGVPYRYSGNKTPPALRKSPRGTPKWENDKKVHLKPLDLTGQVLRLYEFPSAHGGFSDVWRATWAGTKVAVKVLRLPTESETAKHKLRKRLRRELRVWRGLHHEHVLPLYGITSDFGPHTSMVCPWLENGTLNSYLERLWMTLTLSIKFKILCGIASGLSYRGSLGRHRKPVVDSKLTVHSCNVIHGDLTGSNILIDASGKACLSDFGLSMILAEFQGTSYFTSSIHGAVRYAAPEIYKFSEAEPLLAVRVSTHSDVYSFGSVMLQTLSGKVPYHYLRSDPMVLFELYKGVYPQRPSAQWVMDDHWNFINQCWNKVPHDRPTVRDIVVYAQLRYNGSFV